MKKLLSIGLILIIFVGVFSGFIYYRYWYIGSLCDFLKSTDPNNSYTLEAWESFEFTLVGGPGDGCSGKGWIRLRDSQGKVLQEVHSYGLRDTSNIQWQPGLVSFRYAGKDGYDTQQWPISTAAPAQYQFEWYSSPVPEVQRSFY